MWILIVALVVIGTVAAGAKLLFDKDAPITYGGDCASCSTGSKRKCEQECMAEAAVKDIEYFDDEELDRFKGRSGSDYSEEEAEEFRQIMETMNAEDLKAWSRSLVLRGVSMPDDVKDEYILLTEQ